MATIPPLTITDEERVELQRLVRAHTTPQRAAKRARVVLLAADGLPNRQIAPIVGMNQHTVAHWRHRFQAERLAGLQDRKRPGRPLVYDHDQRLRIVATVTQQPPDPASHWSHSQLAKELADMGISASQIGRILADLDIKPHRVRSWITRPQDPGFWERAADICGLYLIPPTGALVLSVDDKTGIGARSRTRPTTRPAPGRPPSPASSRSWTPRSLPNWRCTWCWTTAPPTSPTRPAGGSTTTNGSTPTPPRPTPRG
jgi:transposase